MQSAVAAAVCACVRECACVRAWARWERVAGCRLEAALVRFDCETPPPSSTLTEPLSLLWTYWTWWCSDFSFFFFFFCGGVISGCLDNDDLLSMFFFFFLILVFLKDPSVFSSWFESSLHWSKVMSNSQGWGWNMALSLSWRSLHFSTKKLINIQWHTQDVWGAGVEEKGAPSVCSGAPACRKSWYTYN